MSKLNKLLDKITEASGPDRAIDAEVASVLGWKVYNYAISGPYVDVPEYWPTSDKQIQCPRWTESLDECDHLFRFALKGYRRSLHNVAYINGVYQGAGKEQAVIYHPLSSGGDPKYTGIASSGALAYLAAIIAALQDLEK